MPSRLPGGRFAGEGFGIVFLEAGLHELPVVAGDVGGARDAVVDGETGLLVDPTDHVALAGALTELLTDPERAARLGRAGAARARRPALAGGRRTRQGSARRGDGERLDARPLCESHGPGGRRRAVADRAPGGAATGVCRRRLPRRRESCPRALRTHGRVPCGRFTGTAGSLRPHPLHTPRTVGELARAAWSVRRIARREGVDLVHANSIRAGIVAAAAARMGAPPAVVHVRDVLPDGPLTRLTRIVVGQGASAIVATRPIRSSASPIPRTSAALAVAHSPVDLDRLRAAVELDRRRAQAALGIPADAAPVLGVVAQLTPWKAQDDAVRIVAGLRDAYPGVRLLLVGSAKFVSRSTRHDNLCLRAEA